jgi:predicted transcriptional regulator
MPLIPAQRTVEKETLSLRLDRVVHERLKQYAAFIQSPKDYIIGQALRRLFEKDHEFAAWLKTHSRGAVPATDASDVVADAGGPLAMPPASASRPRAER